jgi:HK97 family phage major capsid protein
MTNEMKEILDELAQIESRNAEIAAEVETAEASVLEERDQESKELEARKAELIARKEELEAEERAATEVAEGKVTEEVELPTEERNMKMEKIYGIDSEEYRSAWAKKLQGKKLDEVEERAYATTDSGNAVPTAVADKFFEKIKKLAPMLSEITLMQVAGNIKFIAEGTRNAAQIHAENSATTPAADTTVSVTLGGNEFMKVIRISKAAETMSINAFENWLVDMLSGDIARAIDNFIINDASNGVVAMVSTATTNKVTQTATAGYGYADICNLVALLPAGYDAEAKFLVSKKVLYNDIKGIVDTNKRPIFDPVEKTLFGYPVVVDDYVPSDHKQVFLGKWTDVVGNLSQPVTVDRSEESGFLNNSIDFRGTAIFDSKLAKNDAIVWLANA